MEALYLGLRLLKGIDIELLLKRNLRFYRWSF